MEFDCSIKSSLTSQSFIRELSKRRRRFQQRPVVRGGSQWDAYRVRGRLFTYLEHLNMRRQGLYVW